MNCPCCGKEMLKGLVQSSRRILFTTIRNESFIDIKATDDVLLSSNNFFYPTCVAYHCGDCKKVVIDYGEKAE